MTHIRILRHYIHTPFLISAFLEATAIGAAAYTGFFTRYGVFPDFYEHLPFAATFAITNLFFMAAVGVYEAQLREGYLGVMLRTGVALFLLGTLAMAVILYFYPSLSEGRSVLLFATVEAFSLIALIRWLALNLIDESFMKNHVVVLGTGERALKIASRMRRRSDQRAFVLHGFIQQPGTEERVSEYGAKVIPYPVGTLREYCESHEIDEIVVAADDRRADSTNSPIPFDELVECRLSGIEVCEVQNFVEREVGKLDIDLLQRSWIVYSEGFVTSWYSALLKRSFDILSALIFLVLLSPLFLVAAIMVAVSDGFRGPILYRQERVGKDGKVFTLYKFRTMRIDAEPSGAVWADHNDPRTTRAGRFLRRSRLDELPQLINVLAGQMSMVGPRPERPVFVEYLQNRLPFYEQRHRIKPGITGWAQLCYPYGASESDSKEKLQYDLYYLKNHSILLDLIILLQTVEVVLIGEGAR